MTCCDVWKTKWGESHQKEFRTQCWSRWYQHMANQIKKRSEDFADLTWCVENKNVPNQDQKTFRTGIKNVPNKQWYVKNNVSIQKYGETHQKTFRIRQWPAVVWRKQNEANHIKKSSEPNAGHVDTAKTFRTKRSLDSRVMCQKQKWVELRSRTFRTNYRSGVKRQHAELDYITVRTAHWPGAVGQ